MKDAELSTIDYTGSNSDYRKQETIDISKIPSPWIIPESNPFYEEGVKIIKGGMPLIKGTDYVLVETDPELEVKTGRSVYLYIELSDEILLSGEQLTLYYQSVYNDTYSVNKLMTLLSNMLVNDIKVNWQTQVTNKPSSYPSTAHQHDITSAEELVGFGGIVDLIKQANGDKNTSGKEMVELVTQLEKSFLDRLDKIQKEKWDLLMSHIQDYVNPHGLKPSDVGLGNVKDYYTASPQQDLAGVREDLYSTPAGLTALINGIELNTNSYLIQGELPLSYYGTGIYIPPSITGSFEGLGGDVENGAFCLEGNGWTVGLIRAFDGKVKNLYFIYNEDVTERYQSNSPWRHTYHQYQHDTITLANKNPNTVISGSGDKVIIIGDCQTPDVMTTTMDSTWWVAASHGTFNPDSHILKPLDISALWSVPGGCRPAMLTVCAVGDWVYIIQSVNSTEGDIETNYTSSTSVTNWQQRFYRFPYSSLTDNEVTSITPTKVNVSFDNIHRDNRVNQPALYLLKETLNSENEITQYGFNFSPAATHVNSGRRFGFVVVPSQNNKQKARVRILTSIITDKKSGDINVSYENEVMIDYEWNVEDNILTISDHWDVPTFNPAAGTFPNSTQEQLNRFLLRDDHSRHVGSFMNPTGSWINGIGYISLGTEAAGAPPYRITVSIWNKTGSYLEDYAQLAEPGNWFDDVGRLNVWSNRLTLSSPFGISSLPRMNSDVYQLKDSLLTSPLEIFFGEDENGSSDCFYRLTTGGDDEGYQIRDELTYKYIDKPIYGRKPNTDVGKVKGVTWGMGFANNPKSTNSHSRQVGLFSWVRRGLNENSAAEYDYSYITDEKGNVAKIKEREDGSIVINLDLDYQLNQSERLLSGTANKDKQLLIPTSFYKDIPYSVPGVNATDVIDIAASFYISSESGLDKSKPYSMWSVVYHLKDTPNLTRMAVGIFRWTEGEKVDGYRTIVPSQFYFPFTSKETGEKLSPDNENNVVLKDIVILNDKQQWTLDFEPMIAGRNPHMEILSFPESDNGQIEQIWLDGTEIEVPGNGMIFRALYRELNGTIIESTCDFVYGRGLGDEYVNQIQANKDFGWLSGVPSKVSGGGMNLMEPFYGEKDKYILLESTNVKGQWTVFVNSEMSPIFNGRKGNTSIAVFDLRDYTRIYKNQVFYIYCLGKGSNGYYELTKSLKHPTPHSLLVATVTTNDDGISSIVREQPLAIAGIPLTYERGPGIPVSKGLLTEAGTYRFIKKDELY